MVPTVRQHCEFFPSVVCYTHRVLFDLQSSTHERTRETFAITRAGNTHCGDFGGGDWRIRGCVAAFLCYAVDIYLLQDVYSELQDYSVFHQVDALQWIDGESYDIHTSE